MIKLFKGSCVDKLRDFKDGCVDLTVTSPPYDNLKDYLGNISSWCEESWKSIIKDLYRVTSDGGVVVWVVNGATIDGGETGSSFKQALWAVERGFKHEVIWFKNVPTGMAQAAYAPMKYHENVVVFCNGKLATFNKQMQEREGIGKDCYNYEHYCGESNHVKMGKVKKFYDADLVNPSSVVLFNSKSNRIGKLHPTQKPVALMEYLIKTYSNEGETVLDFTMGSGTTGVACVNTNRNFIGIELDEKYYNIAKERIEGANPLNQFME